MNYSEHVEQFDACLIERVNAVRDVNYDPTVDSRSHTNHRVLSDSGDSIHLTPVKSFILNIRPLAVPVVIRGAFGKQIVCREFGEGAVKLGNHTLRLEQIVYCPELRDTLLSHIKLLKAGHTFDLHRSGGTFSDRAATFRVPVSFKGDVLSLGEGAPASSAEAEANATTRAARAAENSQANNLQNDRRENQNNAATASPNPPANPAPSTASPSTSDSQSSSSQISIPALSLLAHSRYGHMCGRKLDELVTLQAAKGLLLSRTHPTHKCLIKSCDACISAKMSRLRFGNSRNHQAHFPNDMASADVCGPITVSRNADGTQAKVYMSLIVDMFSGRAHVRLIGRKSEASDHVKSYFHSSRLETNRPLRHFHTDGGTEYNAAERVLVERGVKVTRTPVHTPQHNATAERMNRTLMEMTRALLKHAQLNPATYWQEALHTAVYLHNRLNVRSEHGKTGHELFTGARPDASNMRAWGCDAFMHVVDPKKQGKLEPRAQKGIFLGYDQKREGCYRIKVGGQIIVSRDVKFQEEQFTVQRPAQQTDAATAATTTASNVTNTPASSIRHRTFDRYSTHSLRPNKSHDGLSDGSDSESSGGEEDEIDQRTRNKIENSIANRQTAANNSSANSLRRSARDHTHARQTGLNPDDFGQFALSAEVQHTHANTANGNKQIRESEVKIPATRRAALRSPYAAEWTAAMDSEIASIRSHGTFVMTPRPPGVNVVSCKWVFAVKCKDGLVTRFKARLVARGFSQQQGIDYSETFAPVLKYKTLRLLLAICAAHDLNLELMDVMTAYLNAPLKETVYMAQPDGYQLDGEHIVCLLLKAIYGLRQAGREWNILLDAFIRSLGFTRLVSDPCVYLKRSRTGNLLIISVYVDDIPSAFHNSDRAEWEEIKQKFHARFAIKFLGAADWFLNMRITRDRSRKLLWLDQQTYVESMLEDLRMDNCRIVQHPGTQEELSKESAPSTNQEIELMSKIPYRRAVGLLTYLSNTSRPDIAHAVNLVAQFSQNPGAIHWRAVQLILRYLCGTANYAICFDGQTQHNSNLHANISRSNSASSHTRIDSLPLTVYADASWGNCKDTRRSTSGWLIRLGASWIDWSCHKQATPALSSCEAEYMALTAATTGVMWTMKLLREMSAVQNGVDVAIPQTVPLLHSDNKSAIALANNDSNHNRSKHIDIRHHFIRHEIVNKRISLVWVASEDQYADILTKTLLPRLFLKFQAILVKPRPTNTQNQQE